MWHLKSICTTIEFSIFDICDSLILFVRRRRYGWCFCCSCSIFINLPVQLMGNRCVYMSISNLVRATLSAWKYPVYEWVTRWQKVAYLIGCRKVDAMQFGLHARMTTEWAANETDSRRMAGNLMNFQIQIDNPQTFDSIEWAKRFPLRN